MKISSEAAETIALTPVVVQEMPFTELIDRIAATTGKDRDRIAEVLRRRSVLSGGSRLRWDALEVAEVDFTKAVDALPDSEPWRRFDAAACTEVVLRSDAASVAITREEGLKRKFLKRTSFWEVSMPLFMDSVYVTYSYSRRRDVFRSAITGGKRVEIESAIGLVAYAAITTRLRALTIQDAELYCRR